MHLYYVTLIFFKQFPKYNQISVRSQDVLLDEILVVKSLGWLIR
jgi:hypothetical protein